MTEEQIEILSSSFERCMANGEFIQVFYDHFLASSDAVAEKFAGTDMRRQRRVLRESLLLMLSAVTRRIEDYSFLDPIAERHSRQGADIQPYLYELWIQALLAAVRHCDSRADQACLALWREGLEPAVEYLVARY